MTSRPAAGHANHVSIVDAKHSPAAEFVQRQGIGNAMRSFGIGWYLPCVDLDPVPAADLSEEAVKIEQALEALVAPSHPNMISVSDNKAKPKGRFVQLWLRFTFRA